MQLIMVLHLDFVTDCSNFGDLEGKLQRLSLKLATIPGHLRCLKENGEAVQHITMQQKRGRHNTGQHNTA